MSDRVGSVHDFWAGRDESERFRYIGITRGRRLQQDDIQEPCVSSAWAYMCGDKPSLSVTEIKSAVYIMNSMGHGAQD